MMQMSGNDGDIEPMEQGMIRRLFNFGETTAHEVMMPLIDVVMVERDATCSEARKVAIEHSHARIPVYQERVDRIVGVLDTLELLGVAADEPIQPFIKQVTYVPASKSIQDLLLDMRRTREQVTVVVDEFGGAEGIVSIEDILEEVVEEIQDEYRDRGCFPTPDRPSWKLGLSVRQFHYWLALLDLHLDWYSGNHVNNPVSIDHLLVNQIRPTCCQSSQETRWEGSGA